MQALAVILARGGSTRIPRKNLQKLGGQSLVAWAAGAAKACPTINTIVVSTDDPEIAQECSRFGCAWVKRPPEIAGEHATIEQAVKHALETTEAQTGLKYDYVVSLQAAVPVRPAGAIETLLHSVANSNARGGVTVVRRSPWIWGAEHGTASTWWNPSQYPRSQDIRRDHFEEINSIQVTPRAEALSGRRWGSPLVLLELPRWADIDIDVQSDLDHARAMWPSIEAISAGPQDLRSHLVHHPAKRKVSRPLSSDGAGRIGIVLGNGPQIDKLPEKFFRTIESSEYLSIGINRIAISKRCSSVDFAPDLHVVWDCPEVNSDYYKELSAGLERIAGRTWRLTANQWGCDRWPHDQALDTDGQYRGSPGEAYMRHSSADLCVNILARCGCREIYLFGCELTGGGRCETTLIENSAACASRDWAVAASDGIISQMLGLGVRVYSGSADSFLVERSACGYALPEELQWMHS